MSNLLNIKDQNGNWIPIPVITNGIQSITQNQDYTLTITLNDGTTYTTTSIKGDAFEYSDFTPEQLASLKGEKGDKGDQGIQGEKGDKGDTGIRGVQGERGEKGDTGAQGIQGEKGDKGDKGDAFTYSDFTSEQLASLKGEKGDTGAKGDKGEKGDTGATGQDGHTPVKGTDYWTAADKAEIVEDVTEEIDLSNYVQKTDYASSSAAGVAKVGDYGIAITDNNVLRTKYASSSKVKAGNNGYDPIVPNNQHESTFYGLAKAAGDTTQSQSNNTVGTYTDDAKEAIQTMLGVPSEDDVVTDVQIDNTSIVENGVAKIPFATVNYPGVVRIGSDYGVGLLSSGSSRIVITKATDTQIKTGSSFYKPIVPTNQHVSTFYGLAKVAGHDENGSALPLGEYSEEAKIAIQKMLGVYQAPFRTIKEITITEETKTVYVNSDSNNEPFSLSEMIIFVETVATNNGGIGFFVINNGNVKLTSAELTTKPFVSAANIFYTTERAHAIHMWIAGNRFFGETMDNVGNNGYTMVNKQATRQSMGFCECNAITELFIYSLNDYKFTSGTIKIIGR